MSRDIMPEIVAKLKRRCGEYLTRNTHVVYVEDLREIAQDVIYSMMKVSPDEVKVGISKVTGQEGAFGVQLLVDGGGSRLAVVSKLPPLELLKIYKNESEWRDHPNGTVERPAWLIDAIVESLEHFLLRGIPEEPKEFESFYPEDEPEDD